MLTKSTTFLLAGALGCALPLSRFSAGQASPAPLQADKVVVLKSERSLMLMRGGQVLKTYRVSLGPHPVCAKTRQGDGKTPEGNYVLDRRNPQSKFHLSLHISYPDAADVAIGQKLGVPPFGDIMIHGLPNGWASASALGLDRRVRRGHQL